MAIAGSLSSNEFLLPNDGSNLMSAGRSMGKFPQTTAVAGSITVHMTFVMSYDMSGVLA